MQFNSIDYAVFVPVVFLLYWFATQRNIRTQNVLLIIASYCFYGWWDWRFLSLIAFSSLLDYLVGLGLGKTQEAYKRKVLLFTSIFFNLGILGFFKYFNFFTDSFVQAFTFFGKPITDPALLDIILPVGISFYTFQTLSYTIDVYRNKLKPTHDIVSFFAFVCFFPQLVAGPIERATHLLPQFINKRVFKYDLAADGMRQILWGLFKKIVIADNCAVFANEIFSNYSELSSSTLLLGAFFFAVQIYCDFSGYSDIAIGTGRLFGFNLMRNFAFPYFSRDIAEFWRRWHISLSTWFRDYVYIPLGGSRVKKWLQIRNVFIIFVLSGLWHGANWTFVVWGALNAVYFLPLMLFNKNRTNTDIVAMGKWFPSIKETVQIASTFLVTLLAWVFFRADSITDATEYLSRIFHKSILEYPNAGSSKLTALLVTFFIVEWIQRTEQHGLVLNKSKVPTTVRWAIYFAILITITLFSGKEQEFIYFQF